jgi:hypothetical protein
MNGLRADELALCRQNADSDHRDRSNLAADLIGNSERNRIRRRRDH